MAKVIDYGTYIIDVSGAMLDKRRGLHHEQVETLRQIHDRAVDFVTSCFQHEAANLKVLYYFLGGKAQQLVTMITRHSEYLLRDKKLHETYRDAVQQIVECSYAIRDELEQMREELRTVMDKVGIKVSGKHSVKVSNQEKQQQGDLPFQADYDEPIPLPPLPKPKKRLQRLQPNLPQKRSPREKVSRPKKKIRRLQPKPPLGSTSSLSL
ncbi:MAG: hypothetical protein Q9P01_09475 [Anaerolineae bacterium]|nr:hypothetical protein [Anaerolineae bacterium]MDQ7035047.1 hypothetical protein [Anaerolineae bacterium]